MAKRKLPGSKARGRVKARKRAPRSKARTRKRAKRSRLATALSSFKRALTSRRPERVTRASERYEVELARAFSRTRTEKRERELAHERKRVATIRRGVTGQWSDAERSKTSREVRDIVGRIWKPIPVSEHTGDPIGHYQRAPRREVVRVEAFAPDEHLEDAFVNPRAIRGFVVTDDDTGEETWVQLDEKFDSWTDVYVFWRDYYARTGAAPAVYA